MPKVVSTTKLPAKPLQSPAERRASVDSKEAERVAGLSATKEKLSKELDGPQGLTARVVAKVKHDKGLDVKHPTLKQIAAATGSEPIAAVNMPRRGHGRYDVVANASSDTEVSPNPAMGVHGRYRGDKWSRKFAKGDTTVSAKSDEPIPDSRTHTGQPKPKPEPKYVRASNPPSEPISDVKPAKQGEVSPHFVAGHVVKPEASKPPEPAPTHPTGDIVKNPNAGVVKHDTRLPSPARPVPKPIMVAGPTNAPTERARFGPNKEIITGRKPIGAKAELSTGGTKPSHKPGVRPAKFTSSSLRDLRHAMKGPRAGERAVGVTASASSLPFTLDQPEKKHDSIIGNIANLLERFITKPASTGVMKWKGKPFVPLRDLEAAPALATADTNVEHGARVLGVDMAKGKRIRQPQPSAKDAFNHLFKLENYMNPNKIVNDIVREAFTTGDRKNTTKGNGMAEPGGTARQMLTGEWMGSVAWPFDQASSADFEKSNTLQMSQSKSGMGDGTGGGFQEDVAKEIVNNLLEDSPSAIFSDPDSVGYLINELTESGYAEFAQTVSSICEDAKEEDVVKVAAMIDKLEADKADPFLVEQLSKFATLLIEDDSMAASDKNPEEPNTDKEDAAAKVDNNSTGVEP